MSATINGFYHNYAANSVTSNTAKSTAQKKVEDKKKSDSEVKQPEFSDAAQKLLEKLKKTYGDKMDIMVADFESDDDAREILSRGTKEFSVLFSTDELEKMAADENYEKENMSRVEDAIRMSKEINEKYDSQSESDEDGEKGTITRIGISFNSDGTTSFFVELEKSSAQQKERIEKTKEEHAEEKKAEAKKKDKDQEAKPAKRVTVAASSEEELLEKMNEVDWSKIKEESVPAEGGRFDFSI